MTRTARALLCCLASATLAVLTAHPALSAGTYLGQFHHLSKVASTVPANGDVNPYGVAVVPATSDRLTKGDVLVSNFNDKQNLQGTGTTIVEIAPNGTRRLFATITPSSLPTPCPGGIGLTTALVALRTGWVIVGSLPTTNGMASTSKAGCLIVLNDRGVAKEIFSGGGINGPWDMTAADNGSHVMLFVSNVLNGTLAAHGSVVHRGTELRIGLDIPSDVMPHITSRTVVGSGFGERTDPASLVIGPTGVGLENGTLYVADSLGNRITAIPNALTRTGSAGRGMDVSSGGALSTPLGLTIAPGGDVLTVNAGNGRIVETTPSGHQVAVKVLDSSGSPPGSGALFGLAIRAGGTGVYFVDDATNTLRLLH